MATLKTLRQRIKSVKNTRQITKTMKMVAAAKVRRARAAVEAARPYAQHLSNILNNLAQNAGASAPLLITGRPTTGTVQLVVIGSDRGLCGGLNANLLKAAYKFIQAQQAEGKQVQLVAVGRKIRDAFRQTYPTLMVHQVVDYSRSVNVQTAQELGQILLAGFEKGQIDEVHLLCAECVSMMTQQPKLTQLIPFSQPVAVGTGTAQPRASVEYEPSEEAVLATLLPLNLNQQVFGALLETAASEHAARMTAMDSATRNAEGMIKKLGIQYNRSRQAAITKELIEIISGAQAV